MLGVWAWATGGGERREKIRVKRRADDASTSLIELSLLKIVLNEGTKETRDERREKRDLVE